MQGVELGPGPVRSAAAGQRRGCCGGVCTFILSHWSKAALLAVIISLIVLVSVRVRAAPHDPAGICVQSISLSHHRLRVLCIVDVYAVYMLHIYLFDHCMMMSNV